MTKKELLEKRGDALKTQDGIWAKAEAESRGLSAEEQTQYDALDTEMDAADANLERIAKRSRRNVTQISHNSEGEQGEKNAIAKRFSMTKALRSQLQNAKPLDGLELEMHQLASKEARSFKGNITGVGIPEMLFSVANANKRDLTVGVNTQIGYTVGTDTGNMIPFLQPRLQAQSLGATVLSGLTSNVDFPRNDAIAAAVWEGEVDESAETNPTVDQVSVSPNRLSGTTMYSKQLLLQSSISVDNFVSRQLTRAIEIGLDLAALNGSGTGNQPTGILNTAGIGNVAMGTNGAAVTRAKIIDLITAVATSNADTEARKAKVVVTAHSWWDIALTHPAAFAAILDGLIA